jgi:hypothetical protein
MRLTRADHPATESGPSGRGGAPMEMSISSGARGLNKLGALGVSGGTWSQRLRTAPSGALRLRAGSSLQAQFRALVHPTGIDPPVTDRMRLSASEP